MERYDNIAQKLDNLVDLLTNFIINHINNANNEVSKKYLQDFDIYSLITKNEEKIN